MRRSHALLVAFLVTPPAWLVAVAPPPLAAQAAGAQEDLARGDAAWLRRAEGHQGGRALPGPVGEAIAAYEAALKADPGSLDAYWKLLRGYHFRGEYVAQTREAKQAAFGRGREVAEAGIDRLAGAMPGAPPGAGARARLDRMTPQEAARALSAVAQAKAILLWGAVDWGLWGDAFGRLAAARQGVGDRVRRYGELVLAIDDRFENAGAHRLLGRLHALAPKVPFITGWVDRDKAISELERAVALGPADPTNDLYLAEAILDYRPARKAEAMAILRRLAARQPSPERVVEESKVLEEARALLGRQGASG
jgi:tetratricopeptide (TPR) repeat protein